MAAEPAHSSEVTTEKWSMLEEWKKLALQCSLSCPFPVLSDVPALVLSRVRMSALSC